MKKLLALFAFTLFSSTAFSATNLANITGYDINGSYPDGIIGFTHYSGTVSAGSPSGILNYTGGTGTLADGQIQDSNAGHLIFGSTASITIFLDDYYYIDNILFYSALNLYFGSLQSADISGQTITSSAFGQIVFGHPQDDLFDLTGTGLDTVGVNQITLSNFGFPFGTSQIFTLSEIQVSGTLVSAVPEPSTYALMLGGLGLIGFMAARRRRLV